MNQHPAPSPRRIPWTGILLAASAVACANDTTAMEDPEVLAAEGQPLSGDEAVPPPPDVRSRDGRGPHHGEHHRLRRLVRTLQEDLDLSPEQRAQVDEIVAEARTERRALAEAGERDRHARREAMHALGRETRDALLDVLDADQRTALATLRDRDEERRLARRLARMTAHLGLTEDQVPKVRGILEVAHGKMRALHEEDAAPGPERRERIETIWTEAREAMSEVLDGEQLAALDEHLERRRQHMRRGHRRHHRRGGAGAPPVP